MRLASLIHRGKIKIMCRGNLSLNHQHSTFFDDADNSVVANLFFLSNVSLPIAP